MLKETSEMCIKAIALFLDLNCEQIRCTLNFQNFTQDNRTQGIMEKSQWDLKKIRFQRRRLKRLDDFVSIYKKMHDALLLEYADVERCRKKVCYLTLVQ